MLFVLDSESGKLVVFHPVCPLSVGMLNAPCRIYFPMQNLPKMDPKTSSVVISPVMVPR